MTSRPMISLTGIRKRFGDLIAVDGVDLSLNAGEVHAVLGENGAGKSTLMNVVSGFLAPDEGEIRLDGEPAAFRTPKDALAAGIGMVHQHFRLVEEFTVAENLAIGTDKKRRDLLRHAEELGERFGFSLSPEVPLWQLSVGEKQRVEILRTLGQGARVLVLDEPTSVLTETESDLLLEAMRKLASEGTAVVFITHKLNEVLAAADRITVMRNGRRIETLDREGTDIAELARLMIGDTKVQGDVQVGRGECDPALEPALALEGVSAEDDWGLEVLHEVSFSVSKGEIVGVAGVAGNGQKELEEVTTGMRQPSAGAIKVCGGSMTGKSSRSFSEAGVGYIPEDRRGTGLAAGESIWRNAILKRYRESPISKGPFVRRRAAMSYASDLSQRVNLSTSEMEIPANHLSGGNAQKLLAGRELDGERQCVVAVNPSQGLDVGAIASMWTQLVAARDQGVGILLISADLDEVLHLSDRVLVQYEGRIVGEFDRDDADRHRIGLLMGGGS